MTSNDALDEGRRFNLAGRFHERMREQPAGAALWVDGEVLSYAQLGERGARIAGWLSASGIGRGSRVGVLASRSVLAYSGILGVAWSGAAYVPLSPRTPAARLRDLMRRAELAALIVDASGLAALNGEALESLPRHVLVPRGARVSAAGSEVVGEDALANVEPLQHPAASRPEDLAYLMFTSGTTGAPKGVMVTCGNVEHFIGVVQERYSIAPGDRVSQFFELTFDLSVFDLFATWSGGACLYAIPDGERMAAVRFIRAHELTVWFAVPSAIAFLARVRALAPDSMPSLRVSLFCGEALPADSAQQWRRAAPNGVLENLYGPTEATVACLAEPCSKEIRVTRDRGVVAIGVPLEDTHAVLLDGEHRFVEGGDVGELALCGPQIAAGYWRDRELTAQSFPTLDHPELGRRVFYRTRDLACRDADGRFHFLGRADNQVKIHGHRVELEEIDAHLRAICGSAAAAVAWPVSNGLAEGVVAFVAQSALATDEIRRRLKELVPWYMVPRTIVSVPSLPLTANGKIDRAALRATL